MHFLKQLVENSQLDDPANNHSDIHRHFYRYSKGEFIGPAIMINTTKSRITIKGTHEYEDLIQEIVTKTANSDKFEITGILETGKDLSDVISNLGLEWKLKKSSGQKQIFKSEFSDSVDKVTLLEMIETFRANSYLLLSFNSGPSCKVTTKKRIPQPSKKKIEEDDITKRVQFCSGIIDNNEDSIKIIKELVFTDFISEIPNNFKKTILMNNYKFDDIIIPKNVKNSLLMRLMAIRKGKMIRSLEVDGEFYEKQYNIVV
ncbi:MAG: hypothetical protein ACFFBP_16680 [Promethearchaeota archaeon]